MDQTNNRVLPAASDLAVQFTIHLCHDLTLEQIDDVRFKTGRDPNSNVCYTHDWTDANATMLEALARFGIVEYDAGDEELGSLIDRAWNLAKKARFRLELVEDTDEKCKGV